MNEERNALVDFTMPHSISSATFISRNNFIKSDFGLIEIFLNRFLLYTFVVVIFSCLLIRKIEIKCQSNTQDIGDSSFSLLAMIFSGILLKPLPSRMFRRDYVRIFSLVWYLFGIIFWVNYTTFVLSWALKKSDSLDTIEQLASAISLGKIKICYNHHSAQDNFFKVITSFIAIE